MQALIYKKKSNDLLIDTKKNQIFDLHGLSVITNGLTNPIVPDTSTRKLLDAVAVIASTKHYLEVGFELLLK